MKKTIFLPFLSLLFLISCNPSNTPSSISDPKDEIMEKLQELKDNYTINYTSSKGKYHIYKTKDYLYDEELGGGQFILYDDTMYVYTLHNNVIVPRTPYVGTRSNFESFYPSFDVDFNSFTFEDDILKTSDVDTMTKLSLLTNSTAYDHADLFMENGILNFRFYDSYNRAQMTGSIYSINETKLPVLDNYLTAKIDPETEKNSYSPLTNVLGGLSDNMTFIGENLLTHSGITLLMTKDYIASFSGDGTKIENAFGYITLEDGTHMFTLDKGKLDVDYEVYKEKQFIKEQYPFKKHDFTKFKEISPNTYISSDYYNVQNFCDLLIVNGDGVNLVKIVINQEKKSADISLMSNHSEIYKGTIYNVNTSSISQLDDYLKNKTMPTLTCYENQSLIEATKELKMNFTFVRDDKGDDKEGQEFYGIYSTEDGRKEHKEKYNNFPSTNYVFYDDYAYRYVVNGNSITPSKNGSLTKDEYLKLYSFEAINFHYFQPLNDDKYITNSAKIIKTLSKLIGSNPYNYSNASIQIKDGKIYIEIYDIYGIKNISGHLENINSTSISFIENYKKEHSSLSFQKYENSELKKILGALRDNCNYTIAYQDDPEYNLHFDEKDYDYYTDSTIYFGTYQDGFITGSKSNYVYNFGWIVDEENETKTFAISSHPSLSLNKVSDFNAFKNLSDDLIGEIEPYDDNKYISFDEKIYSVFVDALQIDGVSPYGYHAVILSIENGILSASVVDEINATYDNDNTRHETYKIFASAKFINVGSTKIPNFANIPIIK